MKISTHIAMLAACAALEAVAAPARVPDVAVFDASETLVAVALNGAADGGSSLAIYDAATGASHSAVAFTERTNGLFFCASRALIVWTETAVVRIDPRTGSREDVMPLARGERIAVAPRCDSVAIHGPDRRDVTVYYLASKRRFSYEASGGARAVCYLGDESAIVILATSGALFEGSLHKKRNTAAIPAASGETLGIGCFGKHGLAIGGLQVELRSEGRGAGGKRVPLACSLEHHRCAVSADGRTVATVSDDSGKPLTSVRFHSTSRMQGRESVALPGEAVSVSLSPSGASAVATFAQGPALLVSRANGSRLKLAPPGARIPE